MDVVDALPKFLFYIGVPSPSCCEVLLQTTQRCPPFLKKNVIGQIELPCVINAMSHPQPTTQSMANSHREVIYLVSKWYQLWYN